LQPLLEAMRDGLEDNTLLWMLRDKVAALEGKTLKDPAQAAALAGMSSAAFRKAMTLERQRGRDYRQPRESWPDARTPRWDADAVSAWNQTRARRG